MRWRACPYGTHTYRRPLSHGHRYEIDEPSTFVAKLMPALKMTFHVAKALNLGLNIAKCIFPAVPSIPQEFMDKAEDLANSLVAPGKAEDFACIKASEILPPFNQISACLCLK